ncbi:hypothetical protein FH972_026812 [Carpinus fangiana]|uniref:Uncharacterized protein n=1 Tax=Carpinus fangiana TaxID=176857 RepID=A0A5N6L5G8_9ROSI|nr:hypothetical protein FH972_026812 [Carpinus fangiana]
MASDTTNNPIGNGRIHPAPSGTAVPRSRFLGWLDIGGHKRAMKKTAKELDGFLGEWLEEHKCKRASGGVARGQQDFMDVFAFAGYIVNVLEDCNGLRPSATKKTTVSGSFCVDNAPPSSSSSSISRATASAASAPGSASAGNAPQDWTVASTDHRDDLLGKVAMASMIRAVDSLPEPSANASSKGIPTMLRAQTSHPLRNYTAGETRGGVDRSDVKPLQIVQPEGPSFRVNGYFVEWQKRIMEFYGSIRLENWLSRSLKDEKIEAEVKLTGIHSLGALQPGEF